MSEHNAMNASPPLVSIGMAVRNCTSTLGMALQSILQQTYPHWELWLLDDGSTDKTIEVARNFTDPRIHLNTDGRNLGLSARLNQAVALAHGKYFARMDGDDVCYPERFERQVSFLESQPEIDLLGSGAIVFSGNGQAVGRLPLRLEHSEICARPWAGFYLAHPTWMGRIEWFRKFPYRPSALRAQDQDLLLRTYRHSRFAALPDTLLGYRQETLSLPRVLRGRYHFSRALLRQMTEGTDWRLARGLIEQPLKAVSDMFAVISGLNYRLLRHRAIPIDDNMRTRWEKVWSTLYTSLTSNHTQLAINTPED